MCVIGGSSFATEAGCSFEVEAVVFAVGCLFEAVVVADFSFCGGGG